MWQVKDDQPSLKEAIETAFTGFDEAPPSNRERHQLAREQDVVETYDKGHGRFEYRRLISTTALNDYLDWPGVQQVFQLERQRTVHGQTTTDIAYGITSLSPDQADAARLLALTRGHWAIENSLFHVRDRTFGEDHCRARKGRAAELLAGLRNLAIGLLQRLRNQPPAGADRFESLAAATRHCACHWPRALALLGIPAGN